MDERDDSLRLITAYTEKLAHNPKDISALTSRAYFWVLEQEYAKAIHDYSAAIALKANDNVSFEHRAFCWWAKKDFDKAHEDFNEAIRLNPGYDGHLDCRGYLWMATQRCEKAIEDFSKAIHLHSDAFSAFTGRGLASYLTGEFDQALRQALRDFDESLRLRPSDWLNWNPASRYRVYALYSLEEYAKVNDAAGVLEYQGFRHDLIFLILAHLGSRRAGADAIANRFISNDFTWGFDAKLWPFPVIQFLRGEIAEQALLARAAEHDRDFKVTGPFWGGYTRFLETDDDNITKAHCYIGLDLSLRGRNADAVMHFGWVKQHGNRTIPEYVIAMSELARLEKTDFATLRRSHQPVRSIPFRTGRLAQEVASSSRETTKGTPTPPTRVPNPSSPPAHPMPSQVSSPTKSETPASVGSPPTQEHKPADSAQPPARTRDAQPPLTPKEFDPSRFPRLELPDESD